MKTTAYQTRYLEHQARKRKQITESVGVSIKPFNDFHTIETILARRRSQRVFINKEIEEKTLNRVLHSSLLCPSSCNRHGINLKVITDREEKELLGGLLVGGVGWIHRASAIVLFLADPIAYQSPRERDFMHYCDVGFKTMAMWLAAESLGLGACYVNPNTNRPDIFRSQFANIPLEGGSRDFIFCGALALGYYDKRAVAPKPIKLFETIL